MRFAPSLTTPQLEPILRIERQYDYKVLVCLLGRFRLLKRPVVEVKCGSKCEALLVALALRAESGITRESLLDMLWPDSDQTLAAESLNSLTYRLHRTLGDALGGAAPLIHVDGRYRLNTEAGVGVDYCWFEALIRRARAFARAGDAALAMAVYERAALLYRGDVNAASDVYAAIERERLRDLYSGVLCELAEYDYARGDYSGCLERATSLLSHDPCREDVHRLLMNCYARLGLRARALRQFRLCERILCSEFGAVPERATVDLFDQLRLSPDSSPGQRVMRISA